MIVRGVRTKSSERRKHGHAVIEIALMGPWLLLLFLAVFNFGFFMYAGMSVANAARAAAIELGREKATSVVMETNRQKACDLAKDEMRSLPNYFSFPDACDDAPLLVAMDGPPVFGMPGIRVSITYTSVQLFPLPWLAGRMTLRRQASVAIYE